MLKKLAAVLSLTLPVALACSSATPSESASDASVDAPRPPLPGYEKCAQDPFGCPYASCACPGVFGVYRSSTREGDKTCNLDFAEVCKAYCPDAAALETPLKCRPRDPNDLENRDAAPPPVDSGRTCIPEVASCSIRCDCKAGDIITGGAICKSDGTCPSDAEQCPIFCAGFGGWEQK